MNLANEIAPICTALESPETPTKHVIDRFKEARDAGHGPRTLVIGHRGGYINGPENSLKSFKAAIDRKIDGIEFDVSD
jgi:glycerophosphoryl diester phosphodiesterase